MGTVSKQRRKRQKSKLECFFREAAETIHAQPEVTESVLYIVYCHGFGAAKRASGEWPLK
jgi:hypothetical protein